MIFSKTSVLAQLLVTSRLTPAVQTFENPALRSLTWNIQND